MYALYIMHIYTTNCTFHNSCGNIVLDRHCTFVRHISYMWFPNGKNNKRLRVLSMLIPSGLRRMKKEYDLFSLYTNQPAGYFCSYIRPPGR